MLRPRITVTCGIMATALALATLSFSGKKQDRRPPVKEPVPKPAEIAGIDALRLNGRIGAYAVEMLIDSSDYEKGEFGGRYRYAGKTDDLALKGNVRGTCIFIEESFKGMITGRFYLEQTGDSLKGKWVMEPKWYDVDLVIQSGNRALLTAKSLKERSQETSAGITGTYRTESYWINDMFFSEESPALEVGFNGGSAVIQDLGGGSIRFRVEVVCGPTYHFATAEGTARKEGAGYVHRVEGEEDCIITIKFGDRTVDMKASAAGFGCGFGARAYLDHEFLKVGDKADFGIFDKDRE